jgi:hypothetical protein
MPEPLLLLLGSPRRWSRWQQLLERGDEFGVVGVHLLDQIVTPVPVRTGPVSLPSLTLGPELREASSGLLRQGVLACEQILRSTQCLAAFSGPS